MDCLLGFTRSLHTLPTCTHFLYFRLQINLYELSVWSVMYTSLITEVNRGHAKHIFDRLLNDPTSVLRVAGLLTVRMFLSR